MLEEENAFYIWPYKGEDYEDLKMQLMEDFLENAFKDN
jgi:hypothetical protein